MSSSNLLIHPKTEQLLNNLKSERAAVALMVGGKGFGKKALVRYFANTVLGITPYDTYEVLPAETGSISIDEARSIKEFLKLRPMAQKTTRLVAVYDAHLMTTEAQNALLKLLEEPPADTYFIMTTHISDALLPTILSRVEVLNLVRPAIEDTINFFSGIGYKKQDVEAYIVLSGGLPGLMSRLLSGEASDYIDVVTIAKRCLTASIFDRLTMVESVSKSRTAAADFIDAIHTIIYTKLQLMVQNGKFDAAMSEKLSATLRARALLSANVSSKLVVTELVVSL